MRYYFHTHTGGGVIPDAEGQEFDCGTAVNAEALRGAQCVMAEELRCGRPAPLDWRFQVVDENGLEVSVFSFAELANAAPRDDSSEPATPAMSSSPALDSIALHTRVQHACSQSRRLAEDINGHVNTLRDMIRSFGAAQRG